MAVSGLVWSLTIAVLVALTLFDYFFHVRKTHTPTIREAALWSAAYLVIAMLFGGALMVIFDTTTGVEYFACYLSNEALSVDNLFVFLVIIGSFAVPRAAQQKVLLFGIVIAMWLIATGSPNISQSFGGGGRLGFSTRAMSWWFIAPLWSPE